MNQTRIQDRQPALLSQLAELEDPVLDEQIDELTTLHSEFPSNEVLTGSSALSAGSEALPEIPGYEILGQLGQGGMGIVYRALHLGLKRPVALKVLRHADRPADLHRFRREAELTARLQHPNIVQVYGVGHFRNSRGGGVCPYIAFELVDGGGLDRLLQRTVLRPTEAAKLLRTLAHLRVVHEHGIVHRDLKPANILLSVVHGPRSAIKEDEIDSPLITDNEHRAMPKITDFGLARIHEGTDGGLTRPGQLLGTPGYMAPEQVDGRRRTIGPATDIHALGAILYECLTGRSTYKGASLHETLALISGQDPVPVRSLRPDVPRDLETICLKCLEKEPADRYASASELADDLQRFLNAQPIVARPVSRLERMWRWCGKQPAFAALAVSCAILSVALLCGASWHVWSLAAARSEAKTAREVAATQEYFALLVGARERATRREVGWVNAGLTDLRRAAGLGTRIVDRSVLRGEAARFLAGIDLQEPRTIATAINASRMAFHPRQPLLALGEAKGWLQCTVVLADLQTGRVIRRLSLPSRRCWNGSRLVQDGVTALVFSSDGNWLVAGTRTGWLHRWDLSKSNPPTQSWQGHDKTIQDVLFAANGEALFSSGDDRTVRRWSVADGWKQSHHASLAGRMTAAPLSGSLLVIDKQLHTLRQTDLLPSGTPLPVKGRLARECAGGLFAIADGTSLHFMDGVGGRITQTLRYPGREDAHVSDINFIDCDRDATALVSASRQTRRVRVWEIASGRLLFDLPQRDDIASVSFDPTGSMLAVLTQGEVRLHRLGGCDVRTFACPHPSPVLSCAWLANENGLACLSGDRGRGQGEVTLWSTQKGEKAPRWRGPASLPEPRLPVLVAADAKSYVAWTEGKGLTAMRRDRRDRSDEKWSAAPGELHSLAFAPDGRLWLAAGCRVQARELPGLKDGPEWNNALGDMLTGLGTLYAVAPGRRHVLVGGRDGRLRLLDARTGEPLNDWKVCSSPVSSVALSADEQWGLAGTYNGGVFFLRLATGEMIDLAAEHRDRVKSVAFLGSGVLASGSADRTVRLWRIEGGLPREWLTIPTTRAVKSLVPCPDGKRMAVVLLGDRAVRVWDLDRLREKLADLGLE